MEYEGGFRAELIIFFTLSAFIGLAIDIASKIFAGASA